MTQITSEEGTPVEAKAPTWYALGAPEVASALKVDPSVGLSAAEAQAAPSR